MNRLSEIYEGWKNYIFPSPEIEALAKERIKICVECEFLNTLNVCTKCYCPTAGKARSPESNCPENKWKDKQKEVIINQDDFTSLVENNTFPDVPMMLFKTSNDYIDYLNTIK